MPFHTILRKRVFYRIQGQGTPLVMIHGSMSSHRLWDRQHPLAKKFKLVLLDLPGHGKSEPLKSEITVQRVTNIVAMLIQELNLKEVIPVGHSLGGAISLQLALDHAELLKGLILVGTGAKLGVFPLILEGLRTNYRQGIELTIGDLAFASSADPQLIELSKAESLRCPQTVSYADFVACNNFDVRHRIQEISVPTLVIVGDEDKLTPVKWAQFLADTIQNTKLVIIEKAGHMVMLEQSDQFNHVVKSFLK